MGSSAGRSGPFGLEESEIQTLVVLVRILVGLDHRFSTDEASNISGIAMEVGEDCFWTHMQASYDKALTLQDALEAAGHIQRPPAQREIYEILAGLADEDGRTTEEAGMLKRLRHIWRLDDQD